MVAPLASDESITTSDATERLVDYGERLKAESKIKDLEQRVDALVKMFEATKKR